MELIERGLREQPFSEGVAQRLSRTVRASTAGIYDCKWRVYENWCREQQIGPLETTVQQLADLVARWLHAQLRVTDKPLALCSALIACGIQVQIQFSLRC